MNQALTEWAEWAEQRQRQKLKERWTESRRATWLEHNARASIGLLRPNRYYPNNPALFFARAQALSALENLASLAADYRVATRKKKGKAHEANT